jgi:hypothetical protein
VFKQEGPSEKALVIDLFSSSYE